MSSSEKIVWRRALFILGAGAGVLWGVVWLQRTLAVDPLKEYKDPKADEGQVGIEMSDFDWKAYKGTQLVAEAHVAKATAHRDRDLVDLTQVQNGKYYESGKLAFAFEASSATFNTTRNTMTGTGDARVFNDQMSLASRQFRYDPQKRALIVPGQIVGKLHGGDVKATGLAYMVEKREFEIGPIKWSGVVAQDSSRRRWTFETLDPKAKTTVRGPIQTYPKLRATDGENIILADGAEYNRDTDVLTAKGHVQYFGTDANLTCEQVVVHRKEKRSVFTGNVDMLIKPKQGEKPKEETIPPVTPIVPEQIQKDRPTPPPAESPTSEQEKQLRTGDNLREFPIALTAQRIEYWYEKGRRRAVITGSPQARQELPGAGWRMVWADTADYDGEKETLDLKSKGDKATVRMLNSLGDDAHALSVLLSTREGEDSMDAVGLTMDMSIDEDEIPEKPGSTGGGGGDPPPIKGDIRKRN